MRKERRMAAKNKSNEIKITRVYDAPVEAVWDAWTDPEQVAQWWGPRGFTLTTHSKDRPPMFRVTVLFSETGGKTKMDMSMTLPTPEAAEEARKFIKKAGGDSTWDRLAEYLEKESSGKDQFVIARSFDAPLETMFEMWTDPKHFSKWLPPTGFDMEFIRSDIRPGGSTFYFMTNHKDVKMYGRAEYLKIEKPGSLVYTQQFCDEHENISRH